MLLSPFRRWLGRDLTSLEIQILEPIEKHRLLHLKESNTPFPRTILDDLGVHGSRVEKILLDYIQWLISDAVTDAIDGTVTESKAVVIPRRKRRKRRKPRQHRSHPLWRPARLSIGPAPFSIPGHYYARYYAYACYHLRTHPANAPPAAFFKP